MDRENSLTPLYMQLREIIRYKIESGEYAPCMVLPSENDMVDEYAVTRQTVRNAVDTLIQEGLLRRVPGKGVYVVAGALDRDLEVLQGFTQTMLDRNVTPSIRVLKRQIRSAGEKIRHDVRDPAGGRDILYQKNVLRK